MKRSHYILILIFGILTSQSVILAEGSTEWGASVSTSFFYWKTTLGQLSYNEYPDGDLVGSIGRAIQIKVYSIPSINFSFFEGDRLDLGITIEGDIAMPVGKFSNDYHLLLLPISVNGTNFFELLFKQTILLENLTHSIYINSSISNEFAVVNFKYNDTLDVRYEWDITTGLLTRKSVISPSGLKLIVVPGRGIGFIAIPTYYPPIIYLSIIFGILIIFEKKNYS